MKNLFFAVVVVILFAACNTVPDVMPDNSGAITDTQAEVAEGAATVAAGAGTVQEQATEIVSILSGIEGDDPALVLAKEKAKAHEEDTKKHARESLALQETIKRARLEVVKFMARSARLEGLYTEEKAKRIKAEGRALFMLACLISLLVGMVLYMAKRLF